jgi:hypothetical protein
MGIVNYTYNRSTSGGEIITHLINATDGEGLHFDGAAGNIDIASPPDLGTKFSFEFILQQDTNADNYIVDFDGASTSRFIIGRNGGNFSVFSSAGWYSFAVAPLDDNKVHHLVVTVDGTSAIAYDNGNQIASVTISSAHAIDSATDAKFGTRYDASSNWFDGTFYRARFFNRTLEASDVVSLFENATVPFSDQYSSTASPLMAGTLTSGKLYRIITYVSGDDFTNLGGTNVTGNEFVTTGTTPTDWSNGSSLIQIGCTADYDLSFSNPTQSLMVQDRAGAADGTSSATGVSQVTPLEQVNSKAISVSNATQRTPANGDIVADKVGVGVVPVATLQVQRADAVTAPTTDANAGLLIENTNASGSAILRMRGGDGAARIMYGENNSTDKLYFTPRNSDSSHVVIDSAGNVGIGTSAPVVPFELYNAALAEAQISAGSGNDAGLALIERHASWTNQKFGELYTHGFQFLYDGGANELHIKSGDNTTVNTRISIDRDTGLATFANGIAFSSQTDASGTGITSGATTLSHYESGTWTPRLEGSTSGLKTAGAANAGYYTRVGDVVTVRGTVGINGSESIVGFVLINGLPFTAAANRSAGTIGANNGAITYGAGYNNIKLVLDGGGAYAYIVQLATSGDGYSHTPVVSASDTNLYGIQLTYNAA